KSHVRALSSCLAPSTELKRESVPTFQLPLRNCCGCGAQFHTSDHSKPGYLPEHIVEAKRCHAETLIKDGIDENTAISEASHSLICMRCHQLTYNGLPQGQMQDIVADDFRTALKNQILGDSRRLFSTIQTATF
ncbi:hypothetical protein BVRB_020470, partial [Beta vulgaris subsp. vulgaris]